MVYLITVKQALTGKAIDVCYFLPKFFYSLRRAINDNLTLTSHLQDAINNLRITCGFDKSRPNRRSSPVVS